MTRRGAAILIGFGLLALAACVLRMLVGDSTLGWAESELIVSLRAHRAAGGAVVGCALGVAGVFLQSLLRNPLAAPDLMGLSAGAGFVLTIVSFFAGGALGAGASAAPALVGAVSVLGLVYGLSQRRGLIDPVVMILVGVIVSILLGAGTMLVASLMPDRGVGTARWMMGAISEETSGLVVGFGAVIVALVMVIGLVMGSSFDASALGEDEARSVGVRIGRVRIVQLVGAGVLTAVSIVLAGPIGFVGLVCPHLARLCLGAGHRALIVGAALLGVALVVGADAATKGFVTEAGRVPIGIVTSLIGGPVFLGMLIGSRRAGG